ncbi:MAG TPA: hypothetical protein VE690_23000 [Rhodopila sp.]|nr:hypothetical protein [Rhodopila sp.]
MNAWIRGCLAACSLMAAGAPMAQAAGDTAQPAGAARPAAWQGSAGTGGAAFAARMPNEGRSAVIPDAAASAARPAAPGGNGFNWLAGGGG